MFFDCDLVRVVLGSCGGRVLQELHRWANEIPEIASSVYDVFLVFVGGADILTPERMCLVSQIHIIQMFRPILFISEDVPCTSWQSN